MTTILLGFDEDQISEDHLAQVKKLAPGAQVLVTRDPHAIEAVVEDIEIVAGWTPPDLLVNIPNLRWYQQWWAGIDWMMKYPEAIERDFILTNASGVHAVAISEQVFAFLLAFARGLPAAQRAQQTKGWVQARGEALFELADKTLVQIGVGAIGSRVVRLAAAFEMRVIGVRRNPLVDLWGVEKMVGPDQLAEVVPEADFVSAVIPMTRETQGLIDKRVFERMKPNAYFVNIGRGGVVNEADLIDALQRGSIAGAGLDVFETEPLPEDSPLWEMDNVLITAHYGGATPRYQERAMAIFLDNLRRYQAGETLRNVVDKKLGY